MPASVMAAHDHYYEVGDLLPDEYELCMRAVQNVCDSALRSRLLDRLADARQVQGTPLPKARLDWDELDHEAQRQGVDPMDVFWDRAGRKAGD